MRNKWTDSPDAACGQLARSWRSQGQPTCSLPLRPINYCILTLNQSCFQRYLFQEIISRIRAKFVTLNRSTHLQFLHLGCYCHQHCSENVKFCKYQQDLFICGTLKLQTRIVLWFWESWKRAQIFTLIKSESRPRKSGRSEVHILQDAPPWLRTRLTKRKTRPRNGGSFVGLLSKRPSPKGVFTLLESPKHFYVRVRRIEMQVAISNWAISPFPAPPHHSSYWSDTTQPTFSFCSSLFLPAIELR